MMPSSQRPQRTIKAPRRSISPSPPSKIAPRTTSRPPSASKVSRAKVSEEDAAQRVEDKIINKRGEFREYLESQGWTAGNAAAEVDLWRITGNMRRTGAWANGIDLFYRYHGESMISRPNWGSPLEALKGSSSVALKGYRGARLVHACSARRGRRHRPAP